MSRRLRTMGKCMCAALGLSAPGTAWAQFAGVVPEGVLAVVGAHRSYVDQLNTWNSKGNRVSLSQRAKLRFDGEHLLRGEGGAKLQSLAQELQRYDPNPNNPTSLLKRLDLGTLNVGGSAKLNIRYFGLALGLPARSTFFVAAPLVDINVKTSFKLSGQNNANAIRDELGNVAFEELRSGLAQAAQLVERDVKASVEAAEYTGVDSWRYFNFADVIAGVTFDIIPPAEPTQAVDFSLQGETFVSIPTGHVDNPDVLADVGIGTGAWGLGLGITPSYTLNPLSLSLESNIMGYLPSQQKMRIPEIDETIIPASRRTTVQVQTGIDWGMTAVVDAKFNWFQPQYRLAWKRHERDQIKGKLSGNYGLLMDATEKQQFEHALWFYFSTIELFKQKQFPLPLRFKIAGNNIFKGFNSFENTYFEVQLVSFLPTPWMPE
ncbi:MAG: hypothetical protein FJY29_03355 [Betaproteobacteria bacterium]|nr:hypothetical protein [Betaproteobacteria bacterium]